MEEVDFKRISVNDVQLLSEVAVQAYKDHYLDLWYDNGRWYIEKYFSIEKLMKELNEENSQFYIAYLNKSPAGFLKVNVNAPIDSFEEKKALELERIYLTKWATQKGIGTKLLDLTIQIAKANLKNVVWLKAMDSSTEDIKFYTRNGFVIKGSHLLKHPLMKEELRGMYIMAKLL